MSGNGRKLLLGQWYRPNLEILAQYICDYIGNIHARNTTHAMRDPMMSQTSRHVMNSNICLKLLEAEWTLSHVGAAGAHRKCKEIFLVVLVPLHVGFVVTQYSIQRGGSIATNLGMALPCEGRKGGNRYIIRSGREGCGLKVGIFP